MIEVECVVKEVGNRRLTVAAIDDRRIQSATITLARAAGTATWGFVPGLVPGQKCVLVIHERAISSQRKGTDMTEAKTLGDLLKAIDRRCRIFIGEPTGPSVRQPGEIEAPWEMIKDMVADQYRRPLNGCPGRSAIRPSTSWRSKAALFGRERRCHGLDRSLRRGRRPCSGICDPRRLAGPATESPSPSPNRPAVPNRTRPPTRPKPATNTAACSDHSLRQIAAIA